MKEANKLIVSRLKEARFFARKPQIRLWLETGIQPSTISRIECGYHKPSPEKKQKLAQALGVSEDWLFPESRK
jgi:transcriptional regulator with XRE-family HTH domain